MRLPLLALETSDDFCSVALWDGKTIDQEKDTQERRHAERLMSFVALVKGRCKEGDYQDIVLSVGPGSFTGIRAGMASAIGFSLARKALGKVCRLYPVTSIHGLVMACYRQQEQKEACALPSLALGVLSAGRGRFYAQSFQRFQNDACDALDKPAIFTDLHHLQQFWHQRYGETPMMLCSPQDTLCWEAPFIRVCHQEREAQNLCFLAQNQILIEKKPNPVYLSTHSFKEYRSHAL